MNVQQLVDAIAAFDAHDALQSNLTLDEWKLLAPYLSVRYLKSGDTLMQLGEADRELFILVTGQLQVTVESTVLASLQPGAVVGEGTFFSGQPRSANVVVSQPGVAWLLTWDKFDAMSHKQPVLALQLMKGLAAVLAVRMREAILVGQFT
jgi:CRP/FNR family transcriptional regulator, cyclic AMP receptor protein